MTYIILLRPKRSHYQSHASIEEAVAPPAGKTRETNRVDTVRSKAPASFAIPILHLPACKRAGSFDPARKLLGACCWYADAAFANVVTGTPWFQTDRSRRLGGHLRFHRIDVLEHGGGARDHVHGAVGGHGQQRGRLHDAVALRQLHVLFGQQLS